MSAGKKPVSVHAQIAGDIARINRMMAGIPGYRPCAADAPHLLELVHAAVRYVNTRPATSKATSFIYERKRYYLLFTNLGRVIVCDKKGNRLGASSYGAI